MEIVHSLIFCFFGWFICIDLQAKTSNVLFPAATTILFRTDLFSTFLRSALRCFHRRFCGQRNHWFYSKFCTTTQKKMFFFFKFSNELYLAIVRCCYTHLHIYSIKKNIYIRAICVVYRRNCRRKSTLFTLGFHFLLFHFVFIRFYQNFDYKRHYKIPTNRTIGLSVSTDTKSISWRRFQIKKNVLL